MHHPTRLLVTSLLPAAFAAGLSSCHEVLTPGGEAVLVGAGDIAVCGAPGAEITARLLDEIGGTVFAAGDNAYENGSAAEYQQCYGPTWGRHKSRTRPSPGNHEYQSPGAAPYYEYFGDAAGPAGRGYYSYNVGEWHVISLNSNVAADANSEQLRWLRADLSANRTACALAYWHHPVFSSGMHGNNPHMAEVWRVLDSAGVELAVVGHDHNYERFAPQDYLGNQDPKGMRQIVVGTGGTTLRPFATVRANSEIRNSDTLGVLKLMLNRGSYAWQFVPAPGAAFNDAGGAECSD